LACALTKTPKVSKSEFATPTRCSCPFLSAQADKTLKEQGFQKDRRLTEATFRIKQPNPV
jgi:hypothetical protein